MKHKYGSKFISHYTRFTIRSVNVSYASKFHLLKSLFKYTSNVKKCLLSKEIKEEIAYFIAVRSFIMKSSNKGTPDLKEVNERIFGNIRK